MNFFAKVILGSVAVLLAAAALVLLFRSKETARVEALLREAVGWAADGDAERVAELIDEEFEEDRAPWARQEIRHRIRPGAFEKLEVVDLDVGVSGDEAVARLMIRIQTRDLPPLPETFHIVLRKRGDAWRVTSVRRPEDLRR